MVFWAGVIFCTFPQGYSTDVERRQFSGFIYYRTLKIALLSMFISSVCKFMLKLILFLTWVRLLTFYANTYLGMQSLM